MHDDKSFIAYHKFDLDVVFKVTFGTFEGGPDCHLWVCNFYPECRYMYFFLKLPNIHEPDQFDFCQGQSSNRHLQWKSKGFHLNRHIIFGTIEPRALMSDLWMSQVNSTRHTRIFFGHCISISGFYGLKLKFSAITKGRDLIFT